jgi:hypothetical protein
MSTLKGHSHEIFEAFYGFIMLFVGFSPAVPFHIKFVNLAFEVVVSSPKT